jgi:transcriptional regulator with XRE-family HTH domain
MSNLRDERERRGLSLDDVAERARIPRRYLVALEEDDHDLLPQGPFRRGYRRQYQAWLGLAEGNDSDLTAKTVVVQPVEITDPTVADRRALLTDNLTRPRTPKAPAKAGEPPVVRLVLGGFMLTMLAVLVVRVGGGLWSRSTDATAPAGDVAGSEPAAAAAPERAPRILRVRSTEETPITVRADGVVVQEGRIAPAVTLEFSADERIELEAEDLTLLTIWVDGDKIDPLGNLSRRRRLVFLRDS